MRIASLLPAATEIVLALGLVGRLAAVTFECNPAARARCRVVVDTVLRPGLPPAEIDAWVRDRAARGLPLYELDRAALAAVDPDLILTQDLCRVCALPATTVEAACRAIGVDAEVLSIDPHSLDDVVDAVVAVGHAAGVAEAGDELGRALRSRLHAVEQAVAGRPTPRVLVLEWTDPPFVAGHWVPELVRRAGGLPVGALEGRPSVAARWADLPQADVVLVAPCGFGLDAAIEQCATVAAHLPGVPLIAIDSARYVVQPGPALVDGVEAVAWMLHPDAVAEPPPGRIARARPVPFGQERPIENVASVSALE